MTLRWDPVPYRRNKADCLADVQDPRGRYLIRKKSVNRRSEFTLTYNGGVIEYTDSMADAKAVAERHREEAVMTHLTKASL